MSHDYYQLYLGILVSLCYELCRKQTDFIMTKILSVVSIFLFLVACGGNSGGDSSKSGAADITANPDYQAGMAIIGKNDCLTCHKVDETLIGPPYRDVANKYASMPDTIITHLAHKVMKGGTGVWGQVPMAAHPNLSEADAIALVKYVMLFKS